MLRKRFDANMGTYSKSVVLVGFKSLNLYHVGIAGEATECYDTEEEMRTRFNERLKYLSN